MHYKAPTGTPGRRLELELTLWFKCWSHCSAGIFSALSLLCSWDTYDVFNDLCVSLSLGSNDLIFAREGYKLDSLLKQYSSTAQAKIISWKNGLDILLQVWIIHDHMGYNVINMLTARITKTFRYWFPNHFFWQTTFLLSKYT